MFKITKTSKADTILMRDMKPGQIGVITEGSYSGEFVMRTANTEHPEVMVLNEPMQGNCFVGLDEMALSVELLKSGESITLTVK